MSSEEYLRLFGEELRAARDNQRAERDAQRREYAAQARRDALGEPGGAPEAERGESHPLENEGRPPHPEHG